ncbi:MAG: diguanylate cyclase [Mariprofundus sp.]|nr:diguanylate cyclase [Mariprofundus sp.]
MSITDQETLKQPFLLLTDASNRMHASLDIAEITRIAISSAMLLVHAKAATSALMIDNALAFSEFSDGSNWQPLPCRLALEEEWVDDLIKTRRSFIVSGSDDVSAFDLHMGQTVPVSDHLVVVPVIGKEEDLLACLLIFDADASLFDDQSRALLESLASIMSIAIENSILLAESRTIEIDLEKSVATYRTLVEQIPAITYIASLDRGRILFVSPQIEGILGYSQNDFLANQEIWSQQIHDDDRDRVLSEVKQSLKDNIPFHSEYRICSKDGNYLWVQDAASKVVDHEQDLYFQGVVHDISERKESEERLMQMAHFDQLTGLANRGLFHDRLDQVVAHSKRHQQKFAVLYLDLDGFKAVNDNLGHQVGDDLLIEAARRLKSKVREVDTVARMGGDEFTVILDDVHCLETIQVIANKLIQAIAAPYQHMGDTLQVTMSMGIAVYPEDSANRDLLITAADNAMYAAKNSGKNRYCFHQREK